MSQRRTPGGSDASPPNKPDRADERCAALRLRSRTQAAPSVLVVVAVAAALVVPFPAVTRDRIPEPVEQTALIAYRCLLPHARGAAYPVARGTGQARSSMPAQSGRLGKSNEEPLAYGLVLRLFMQLVGIDLVSEAPPLLSDLLRDGRARWWQSRGGDARALGASLH